ncbi:MAG: DUF4189 domain-containing protein [Gloeomargarita sp. SKYBB_i_bin120]|nr:DUF4189 domain-containing protein [Gloeomargarita sp. SKYG98]MCS7292812.1 DUF4189 domain-containing protein [Gloeomargarita sp. SKYB120]MDW8178375.1 DUF4189 domain-containing protein [Gloeomargarita sp. SKYBB_i_bin120]
MKRQVWFGVGILLLVGAGPVYARDQVGAIAIGKGRFGYSYDWSTPSQAQQRALQECGSPDCKVVLTFSGGCGAVAEGQGRIGIGTGKTRQLAEQAAIKVCNDPTCQVTVWACNSPR